MNQLTRKVAIVTGAGLDIGRAIAQRYHEEGAKVAIQKWMSKQGTKLQRYCSNV